MFVALDDVCSMQLSAGSLEVESHSTIQKLGDGDVIVISLSLQVEFNHQSVVVLVNGDVVILRQELGNRDVVLGEELGDGLVVEEETTDGGLEELCHSDVV